VFIYLVYRLNISGGMLENKIKRKCVMGNGFLEWCLKYWQMILLIGTIVATTSVLVYRVGALETEVTELRAEIAESRIREKDMAADIAYIKGKLGNNNMSTRPTIIK